jgi:hypothetical protein
LSEKLTYRKKSTEKTPFLAKKVSRGKNRLLEETFSIQPLCKAFSRQKQAIFASGVV